MNEPLSSSGETGAATSQPVNRGCLVALATPAKIVGHNLLLLALALWQGWSVLVLFWPLWAQSLMQGVYLRDRLGVDPMPESQRVFRAFFTVGWGGFHLFLMTGLLILSIVALGREDTAAMAARSWVSPLGWVDLALVLALGYAYWEQHRRRMRSPDSRRARSVKEGVRLLIAPLTKLFPMYLLLVASLSWGEAGLWAFLLAKMLADLLALPAEVLFRMEPEDEPAPMISPTVDRSAKQAPPSS